MKDSSYLLYSNNMRSKLLRILIDTNIFIHREDYGVVPKELQDVLKVLKSLKAELLLHPKSFDEIKKV